MRWRSGCILDHLEAPSSRSGENACRREPRDLAGSESSESSEIPILPRARAVMRPRGGFESKQSWEIKKIKYMEIGISLLSLLSLP